MYGGSGNSLGRLGDYGYDDPFSSAVRQQHQMLMQRMDPFAQFRDPFGMMGLGQQLGQPLGITDNGARQRDQQMRAARQQQLATMSPGLGMFGGGMFDHMNMMNQMMGGMQQQMVSTQNDPNSQFYSSSTMMSYDSMGGQPRVYQESSSTTQAAGVKETKRAVRDSETGIHKMSVGRQIGDRAHTITKEKNVRTGDEEENVDFVNLDEEEASEFDREWRDRTRTHPGSRSLLAHRRQHERPRAITEGRSRSPHQRVSHTAPVNSTAPNGADEVVTPRQPIHQHHLVNPNNPHSAAAATHSHPATYPQHLDRDGRHQGRVAFKPPQTKHLE